MATDYQNEHRSSHAPDYRTRSGGSNGWLIGLAVAILLAMIAFFSFAGSDRPAITTGATTGTTSEQVIVPPATESAPAAQEQAAPPATTAPAQ
ncbi:hypothetical protein [Anderseniella sp. Alg231-50]|uniref:hypothetical protein n=1 Tax=Anderseniella sp. Alg231-50 TaxID=1922226 RepID=UPI000D55EFBC